MASSTQNRVGRPSKLNDEVMAAVCDRIAQGVPDKHAIRLVGISDTTHAEWMRRGKVEQNNLDQSSPLNPYHPVESEAPFLAYFQGVMSARSRAVEEALGDIKQAALGWVSKRTTVKTTTWTRRRARSPRIRP
jgi:hypothetical protein